MVPRGLLHQLFKKPPKLADDNAGLLCVLYGVELGIQGLGK